MKKQKKNLILKVVQKKAKEKLRPKNQQRHQLKPKRCDDDS